MAQDKQVARTEQCEFAQYVAGDLLNPPINEVVLQILPAQLEL